MDNVVHYCCGWESVRSTWLAIRLLIAADFVASNQTQEGADQAVQPAPSRRDHLLDSLADCDRLGVGLVASGKGVADPSTCFDGFEGLGSPGLAKSLRSW
jgi:hypothetical protein